MGYVKKLDTDRYELTYVINGELCKIIVKKNTPRIVEIEDIETDKSYINALKPYVIYNQEEWVPPKPSRIYYEDGSVKNMNYKYPKVD